MSKRSRLEEELMLRRVDKFLRGIITVLTVLTLILFVYSIDLFGVSRSLARLVFHEKNIVLNSDRAYPKLVDWRLNEDGSFTALSDDPMLLFWGENTDIKLKDIRSVDIDIAYRTNVFEDKIQIYYMPNDDMVEVPIHSGQNHIELTVATPSASCIRITGGSSYSQL